MPVIPLSTGFIDRVGAAAGGSVSLVGAFMGCEFVSSTTGKVVFSNNWPGSGAVPLRTHLTPARRRSIKALGHSTDPEAGGAE